MNMSNVAEILSDITVVAVEVNFREITGKTQEKRRTISREVLRNRATTMAELETADCVTQHSAHNASSTHRQAM